MIVVNRAEVERLMIEKGVTVNQLLTNYGMTYVTFNRMMEGESNFGIKKVGILCDALGCQPCDILIKVKND